MEEEGKGAKVRVVRCPKCERLLPELTNFSVYKCGGCDATLQAKRPIRASEDSMFKIDGKFGKSDDVILDARMDQCTPIRSDRGHLDVMETGYNSKHAAFEVERRVEGRGASTSKSCIGSLPNVEVLDGVSEEQCMTADGSDRGIGKGRRIVEEPKHGNCMVGDKGIDVSKESRMPALTLIMTEKKVGNYDNENLLRRERTGSHNSPKVTELARTSAGMRGGNREFVNGSSETRGLQRSTEEMSTATGVSGYTTKTVPYPGEGLSKCDQGYPNSIAEHDAKKNKDGTDKDGCPEQNQAELLRMLDKLRAQVERTYEVADKQSSSGPVDKMTYPSSYVPHGHVNCFPEISLKRNPSGRSPVHHDRSMLNLYPNVPVDSGLHCCQDPVVHRGAPFQPRGEYLQRHGNGCIYGQCDPDPVMPYHHESSNHQHGCSCSHCYQRQFLVPATGASTVVGHQRVPYVVHNHEVYTLDGSLSLGDGITTLPAENSPSHLIEQRVRRRTLFNKNGATYCRPLAGAAPFTFCVHCSELLQLPERSFLVSGRQFKLRCGSCSKLIPLKQDGNKLVSPGLGPAADASGKSNSCDGTIQSIDEKLVLPYIFTNDDHEMLKNTEMSNKIGFWSSSSLESEDFRTPESVLSHKDVPSSSDIPLQAHVISRVPSLPHREHFEYSSSEETDDKFGPGRKSKHSDRERNKSWSGDLMWISTKAVQVANEVNVPVDEYPTDDFSHDYWDTMMKKDAPNKSKVIKTNNSFIAGFIKKSLLFNHTTGKRSYKISINGHPISNRLAKKAEKQAGPVYPGDYWYDYRAGFWGVMGHECVGIIQPFIEEFNYPMPKNCAGGNTGILVNGRQLHERDLDLLVGRGLPDTRGCSYIINIAGKVWDELYGKELDSLGKLAPSIERMKRGFGMWCPSNLS